MKGIAIVVPKKLLKITGYQYQGMVLYPVILLTDSSLKKNKIVMNHERIHLKQQLELLIIPFYLIYFINYCINRFKYKDHQKAYLNIIFEREAYKNERDLDYLKKRKVWAFLGFF